jgi:hypothetical protein
VGNWRLLLVELEPFPSLFGGGVTGGMILEPFPAKTDGMPINIELLNVPRVNKEVKIFIFMFIT